MTTYDQFSFDMCTKQNKRTNHAKEEIIIPWWKPSCSQEKPPYTYATLIAHALLSSEHGCLTLNEVYHWISKHYPYYVIGCGGWQNSIRHNLSLKKKTFSKTKRPTQDKNQRKKGCYWKLLKEAESDFIHALTKMGGQATRRNEWSTQENETNKNSSSSYFSLKRTTTLMPSTMFITRPEDYQHENDKKKKKAMDGHTSIKENTATTTASSLLDNATNHRKRKRLESNRQDNHHYQQQYQYKQQRRGSSIEPEDTFYDSGVDVDYHYKRPKQLDTTMTTTGAPVAPIFLDPLPPSTYSSSFLSHEQLFWQDSLSGEQARLEATCFPMDTSHSSLSYDGQTKSTCLTRLNDDQHSYFEQQHDIFDQFLCFDSI
ncbi:uncharacterized protein BX664DRAFT_387642 [Halteromyces radiatus]|uniref:uncharacterized protein n=1 Tax=Halteromyces radiatus TaxID=101107 RepID=UPI00222042EE|nr:uncharacterized protein BX664DRAFT_387642 [Halteromyces radiatus]KAI8084992.1 hypothetical protein BX664DRAFT_387642 [Halteromyces radiatus]